MVLEELAYLFVPISLSNDYRTVLSGYLILSATRLGYIAMFNYDPIRAAIRGLVLLTAVSGLFFYGAPEQASSLSFAILCGYAGVFPRYTAVFVIAAGLFLRYITTVYNGELQLGPYSHGVILGGAPISALAYMSHRGSIEAAVIAGITIIYRTLLLVRVKHPAFVFFRALLSLFLTYTIFIYVERLSRELSPYLLIAAALTRPSILGSEFIRMSVMLKTNAFIAFTFATYLFSIYSLYGAPSNVFFLGLIIVISLILSTAILQDIFS